MAIRTALGAAVHGSCGKCSQKRCCLRASVDCWERLLGSWISRLISSIHFPNFPLQLDTSFDWRVFSYAFAVVLFGGISLVYRLHLRQQTMMVNVVLHQGNNKDASGTRHHKVRRDLMVLQVADL